MNLAQLKAVGDIHEIVPGLFLGNMWSTDPNVLNQYGINVVITVARPETDANKGRYKLDSHLVFEIDDNTHASEKMSKEVLPKAIAHIDRYLHPSSPTSKRVLVHCMAGVSRSSTVVIAWIMKRYGYTRDKAIELVRSRRSVINPNDGFMKVLSGWEQYLKRFHWNNAQQFGRVAGGGRSYNYPKVPNNIPKQHRPQHHLFPGQEIDHFEQMQHRQFERRFSVIPSESHTLDSSHTNNLGPSYYREFEEKIHSNDDHFRHLY